MLAQFHYWSYESARKLAAVFLAFGIIFLCQLRLQIFISSDMSIKDVHS